MKKLLTCLMAGALLFGLPVANVFAEETEIKDIVNSKEGTVKLTATKASAYSIQLPVSVDVSTSGTKIALKAKGDVDSAYQIVVSEKEDATNLLVDTSDSNNTVAITVTTGDAIPGANVTDQYGDTAKTEITITHGGLTAGSYSYDLPLVISLATITA